MRQSNHLKILFSCLIVFVLLAAYSTLYMVNKSVREKLFAEAANTLSEILQQQAYNFSSKIKSDIHLLRTLAAMYSDAHVAMGEDDARRLLWNEISNSDFEYIMIADLTGRAIRSDGADANISDRDYFKRALKGETVVSDPIISKFRNATIIAVATPLYTDEWITGVLVGSYDAKKFDKLLLSSFNGNGYAYIIDDLGKIISKTQNAHSLTTTDNLFDVYSEANFYGHDGFELMKQKLFNDESGLIQYEYNDHKRVAEFGYVGINNWNIVVVVPEEVIYKTLNEVTKIMATLTAVILFGSVLASLYVIGSQRKHMNELWRMAYTDELTGIRNLSKFKLDAKQMLENRPDAHYMMAKLDVENFQLINEICGFAEGDNLLKGLSKALGETLNPDTDVYGRVNADMFVALVNLTQPDAVHALHEKFMDNVTNKLGKKRRFKLVIPIGRYFLDTGETDVAKIFEKVNFAHRLAKQSESKICDFDDSVRNMAIKESEIESMMEDALRNEEFKVFLQSKHRLTDGGINGCEALVRWRHGDKDVMYPGEFIHIFEQNGFITMLDMYMFEKSCAIIADWIASDIEPIPVSVNFSRLHLSNPDFVSTLRDIADKYDVPHNLLEIEITETAIQTNEEVIIKVINSLHAYGFAMSMDDFGSGYSSLGLLKNIPVDAIKIDRQFFINNNDTQRANAVIAKVIDLAKTLHMVTVAEGIETDEQVELLRILGCDSIQSYYFARPIPADDFKKVLQGTND